MRTPSSSIKAFVLLAVFLLLGGAVWYQSQAQSQELNSRLRELLRLHRAAPPPLPAPPSPELVQLGRDLFFDKILSGNKNISCATCHNPQLGSADASSLSIGQGGYGAGEQREIRRAQLTMRNAPALFNLSDPQITAMFWDGRVQRDPSSGELKTPADELNGPQPTRADLARFLHSALEAQTLMPPTDPAEMRGRPGENEIANAKGKSAAWDLLLARVLAIPEYAEKFAKAFPETPRENLHYGFVARALAAFIGQAFVSSESPYDRFLRGDDDALPAGAKRGAILFFDRAGCASCHGGPHLSDFTFASKAIPQIGPGTLGSVWEEHNYIVRRWTVSTTDDFGRYNVTREIQDRWKFRIPPLRNVALTGPWMHNGAFVNLGRVIEHMADPARSLKEYDGKELKRPEFARNLIANKKWDRERLGTLDDRLKGRVSQLDGSERKDLLEFLVVGLTDPRWEGGRAAIPERVPSGLDPRD